MNQDRRQQKTAVMQFDRLLPEKLCSVRPLEEEDGEQLVSWIEQGRRQKVFRAGAPLDVTSLRRYQEEIRRAGWDYACFVVEADARPIGYLDQQIRRQS